MDANLTIPQRLVYDILDQHGPMTPAQIKKYLPGRTPVDTIRGILYSLSTLHLTKSYAGSPAHPGITRYGLIR